MDEERFVISDESWIRLEPLLPGKDGDSGTTGKDNRLFLEAVLWRVRTGLPWRDLPREFGNWNSTFRRFRRWAQNGVFERVFKEINGDPDFEYAMIDGTIVQAHQKAAGAKGGLKIRPSDAREAAAARGHDDQDRGAGRCLGKPRRSPSPARSGPRHEGRHAADRGRLVRGTSG